MILSKYQLITEFHCTQLGKNLVAKSVWPEKVYGIFQGNPNGKKSKAIENFLLSQFGLFHSVFISQIRRLLEPDLKKIKYKNFFFL